MMGTMIIIPVIILAIVTGIGLSRKAAPGLPLPVALSAGSVVGLALLSWSGFLACLILGLNAISISLSVSIVAAAGIVLYRMGAWKGIIDEIRGLKPGGTDLTIYALWTGLMIMLFSRVVDFTAAGLMTAPANNFGDLPFHLSVINSIAWGENLPPENPVFAGSRFTYPLLIDFLAAYLIRCGASLEAALFFVNLPLSVSLVGLLDYFTRRLTGSAVAGRIAPALFFFNGGLGFVNFFGDLSAYMADPVRLRQGLVNLMLHLPKTYTMNAELSAAGQDVPIRWGNVITTLLIPQRSMLFGLPFVVMILTLWWTALKDRGDAGKSCLLASGVLTGMLPMLHAHGFFSVMIAWPLVVALYPTRDWLRFMIPAGLLSAPQALYLSGTQVRDELFKYHPWWEAGNSNPALFWAVNAGFLLALAAAALASGRLINREARRFQLPFWIWFILPNAVLLAPWTWDNIKVLVYWSLIACAIGSVIPAFLIGRGSAAVKIVGTALLAVCTLSGALDVIRALSPVEKVPLFGSAEVMTAERIRQTTPPRSVILHAPIHNSTVALSGRISVMGYPGHLWTHGINFQERENDVKTAFRGGPEAIDALSRLKADYLLIGPIERLQMQANERFFRDLYRTVFTEGEYSLYRIDRPGL